jgi:hypothetical protein
MAEQAKARAEVQKAQLSVAEQQVEQHEIKKIELEAERIELAAVDPKVVLGESMQHLEVTMNQCNNKSTVPKHSPETSQGEPSAWSRMGMSGKSSEMRTGVVPTAT